VRMLGDLKQFRNYVLLVPPAPAHRKLYMV